MGVSFWTELTNLLEPLEKAAAILGNLGQVVTAALAGLALGFAWAQIKSGHKAQREATLRDLNRDQNRLSFESPEFARPVLLKDIDFANRTIEGNPIKFERYYWFVVIGLAVCERAIVDGVRKGWDFSINDFLMTHQEFLSRQNSDFWNDYDKLLQKRWRNIGAQPIQIPEKSVTR
jgi:hypothetical protein